MTTVAPIDTATSSILPAENEYNQARTFARQYKLVEKVKFKLLNQDAAFERLKIPRPLGWEEWFSGQQEHLRKTLQTLDLSIHRLWRGTLMEQCVSEEPGLGVAVFRVLSLLPHSPCDFVTVAKLWKFFGLHPNGAREDQRYDHVLKAWLIYRVAEPCIKVCRKDCPACGAEGVKKTPDKLEYVCSECGAVTPVEDVRTVYLSRYRRDYDVRKDRLPDMLEEGAGCPTCDAAYERRRKNEGERTRGRTGWDCHNMGGPHYKPAHRHADALRVTAKAILRDLWCIANERPIGGNGDEI